MNTFYPYLFFSSYHYINYFSSQYTAARSFTHHCNTSLHALPSPPHTTERLQTTYLSQHTHHFPPMPRLKAITRCFPRILHSTHARATPSLPLTQRHPPPSSSVTRPHHQYSPSLPPTRTPPRPQPSLVSPSPLLPASRFARHYLPTVK